MCHFVERCVTALRETCGALDASLCQERDLWYIRYIIVSRERDLWYIRYIIVSRERDLWWIRCIIVSRERLVVH